MFFAPFYRLSNGFYCLSLLSSQQSWVLFHNYYNSHTCQTAFSIEFLFYLFISTTSHQCWNRLYFTLKKWVLFPPLTVQIYQHFSVDILTCIHRYARAFQITWASFNFVWNFLPSCDELQVTNGSRFRDNTYKLCNIFIYIYWRIVNSFIIPICVRCNLFATSIPIFIVVANNSDPSDSLLYESRKQTMAGQSILTQLGWPWWRTDTFRYLWLTVSLSELVWTKIESHIPSNLILAWWDWNRRQYFVVWGFHIFS